MTNLIHVKHNEKTEVEAAIERTREQFKQMTLQLQEKTYERQLLNQAHDETIEKLATIRPVWRGLNDLYLKESSVTSTLIDMQLERKNKRESILLKERLAHRFTDDYGEQSHFFTDPYLNEKINDWQNSLVVQTGTAYIENLPEAERNLALSYGLWPLTIVTTSTDKPKIQQQIINIKDKLQHPVIIVTLEEAKE